MISAPSREIEAEREVGRLEEIKNFVQVVCHNMALPLYFVFWICDLVWYPHFKWKFLALRAVSLPICWLFPRFARRARSSRKAEKIALGFSFCAAIPISVMVAMTGGALSPYYAGLNLVAIGTLSFLPLTRLFYSLTAVAIYGPYYLFCLLLIHDQSGLRQLAMQSFFIIGTISISLIIRYFSELLRTREIQSRVALMQEIKNRDLIIAEKTNEAVNLASLSKQFSPQVIEAIRNGKIGAVGDVHRPKICALFVDIVNSTERVLNVDKDKVHQAISMFMDDSIKTLLKYDLTVDKFLGDGVLAFGNDPVAYPDYIERAARAALEIREKIQLKGDAYSVHWMSRMSIRIGLATGYASVGFYGSDRYFKSYTAIGPVVNLASRLCGAAGPDEILVSADVHDALEGKGFELDFAGEKSLKGFDGESIKTFRIIGGKRALPVNIDALDCPSCNAGILYLDTNENGIFVFRCRSCGHMVENLQAKTRGAA